MNMFLEGLSYFTENPTTLILLCFGVFFGLIFGCIPGLTATLGVILMTPFTFAMGPEQGLSVLIGIYVGGISGGLITAILINIPGTPSSLVTCWDGYPLAQQGYAGAALSLAVFSSLVGGLFSAFALMLIAPQLAKVALMFGSWEYFTLILLGLSVVTMLTANDPAKGLLAAFLGLLFGAVGMDRITGIKRLTFGFWQIEAGIAIIPILMGFFAIREILLQVEQFGGRKLQFLSTKEKKRPILPPKWTLKGGLMPAIIGCTIGTVIGMLPGVGQSTAAVMSYNQTKAFSKTPEKFGKGSTQGIIASETSNNAVNGGALIPLVTLGIPGDMVTAVLIGGLMIHGLQPGPLLFRTNPGLIGAIIIAYFLANIFMYIMEMGLLGVFIKIAQIPLSYLFTGILMTSILGVFAASNRFFDVLILFVFGIVGYVLDKGGFSFPPIVLGYFLGPLLESSFRISMISSRGNFSELFSRPIALFFFTAAIAMLVGPFASHMISNTIKLRHTKKFSKK